MPNLEDWFDILAPYAGREENVTLSVSGVTRLICNPKAARRHSYEGDGG
jgi:hypothetical protein